jgi:hypothetical protein
MYRDEWQNQDELWAFFDSVTDPEELHIYADHFNWDGGVGQLRRVIHHPLCDGGTALLIYWRGGPGTKAMFDEHPDRHLMTLTADKFDLLLEIEQMVIGGHWKVQRFAYDPRNDRGRDLLRLIERLPKKRMPPSEMYDSIAST